MDDRTQEKDQGMKIMLTGASGFLGRHIRAGLSAFDLISLGRHVRDDIRADITDHLPNLPKVDMVVHAAGKAHVVPANEQEANEFHRINMGGTRALAEQLSAVGALPDTFVLISTVAVYGAETGTLIPENNALKGETPYAKSKIDAENWITNWGISHGVNIVILRLPLVVGKDAPGNLGAMIKNIRRGTYARIGTGDACRSMVLATDITKLIPSLLGKNGIYNLTDGIHPSVAMMEDQIAAHFGKKIHAIPPRLASILARIGDFIPSSPFNTYRYAKLRQSLTFSDEKAVRELHWSPTPVLKGFEI
jgi:nucleoside-diphosphate-sugar epimerase